MPSETARARILEGLLIGSGAGQSAERTRAVAPLLAGFPSSSSTSANPLLAIATLEATAKQREDTLSALVDRRLSNSHSFYIRYLRSNGELNTPDRTVTPRRVLAKQTPQNAVLTFQSLLSASLINEA